MKDEAKETNMEFLSVEEDACKMETSVESETAEESNNCIKINAGLSSKFTQYFITNTLIETQLSDCKK